MASRYHWSPMSAWAAESVNNHPARRCKYDTRHWQSPKRRDPNLVMGHLPSFAPCELELRF